MRGDRTPTTLPMLGTAPPRVKQPDMNGRDTCHEALANPRNPSVCLCGLATSRGRKALAELARWGIGRCVNDPPRGEA